MSVRSRGGVAVSRRPRLIALHHRTGDRTGHRFQEALGLVDEAPRRGFDLVLLIPAGASPAVRAALPEARAVLRDPTFGPGTFDERTHAFVEMLRAEVPPDVRPDDVVLVTVGTQCETRALAVWLGTLPVARRPAAVVLFHSDRWNRSGPAEYARQASELRVLAADLAALAATDTRRVVLGATTATLARELSMLLGVRVTRAPLTQTYAHVRAPDPPDPLNDPPCIGFLGGARPEKGSSLVPALVDACRRRVRVRFLVHLLNEQLAPDAWARLVAVAEAPDVEAVEGELDPAPFAAALARSDVLVLPYDRVAYRQRQSAVLAEAAVAGRVVVVPSGTWMSAVVTRGEAMGVAYAGGVEGAAGAVAECVHRLAELRVSAARLAPAWRARESLAAFLDWMAAQLSARRAG